MCFPLPGIAVCRLPIVLFHPLKPAVSSQALLRGHGLRLRRLDDPGLEVRRRHDLEHLEILVAGNLAMRDARDLIDAIALADRLLAVARVLERGPSIHVEDHLERALMAVPLLHFVFGLVAFWA